MCGGNHLSGPDIAIGIERSTRPKRNKRYIGLLELSPREVYPAFGCCHRSGELLPHHFTLIPHIIYVWDGIFSVALAAPTVVGTFLLGSTVLVGVRTFLPAHNF